MQISIQNALDELTEEESLSTGNSSDTPSNSASNEQKSVDKRKWLSSLIEGMCLHLELSKLLSEDLDALAGENMKNSRLHLFSKFKRLCEKMFVSLRKCRHNGYCRISKSDRRFWPGNAMWQKQKTKKMELKLS